MITVLSQNLSKQEPSITYDLKFRDQKVTLHSQLYVGEDHLKDYQIEMFQEAIAEIVDIIQSDDTEFQEITSTFEKQLHGLNTKLTVFAHKSDTVSHFPVSGHVALIFNDQLVISMIGNASVLIFRNQSLIYSMSNQSLAKSKIDLFGELIEGELTDGDSLVMVGHHLDTFLDDDDYQQIHAIAAQQDVSYAAALVDILSVRVEPEDLKYVSMFDFST